LKVASYQPEKVFKLIQPGIHVSHIPILPCNATLEATLGIGIPGSIMQVVNHSGRICIHPVKTDGMLQVAMTTTATKTDGGDTRMGAVETSIEWSGGEDVMKLGGIQPVKRIIERSGEWDVMKEGGPWEAVTTPAVSQRPGKQDGRLLHVRSLPIMVPPTTQ